MGVWSAAIAVVVVRIDDPVVEWPAYLWWCGMLLVPLLAMSIDSIVTRTMEHDRRSELKDASLDEAVPPRRDMP